MRKIISFGMFFCSSLFAQSILPVDSTGDIALSQPLLMTEQQITKCSVFGTVIDQSTQEPIGNARILVLGTKIVAITTPDGRYALTVDADGFYQLKAEAEGYESQIMNNVYFKDGEPAGFFKLKKLNQSPADFVEVDKQPVPIQGSTIAPGYPEQAKKERIEGTAWVKVWIDEKGSPRKVEIVKSDAEIFNQPSIDAAMKWKFEPAILKGKPVAVWVTIPFKFKLDSEKHQPKSETKKK